MTWNRLRWIARLLEMTQNRLPDIQLSLPETPSRSWINAGQLHLSHPDLLALSAITDGPTSDLTLLLNAISSVRRARSITVKTPPFKDLSCQAALRWLKESAIKTWGWGDDIHTDWDQDILIDSDENICSDWDDWDYVEFLEYCELRFHKLLGTLETPVAPFLRLEQLASMTHFSCYRLFVLSRRRSNDNLPGYKETQWILKNVLDHTSGKRSAAPMPGLRLVRRRMDVRMRSYICRTPETLLWCPPRRALARTQEGTRCRR